MLKFGIFRNFDPAASFLSYKNQSINRYVEHQLRRLAACKSEVTYGRLAMFLIRHSMSFRVMALHHVFCAKSIKGRDGKTRRRPAWYKGGPVWAVANLLRKVEEIARNPLTTPLAVRAYVEKDGGKWRPIGNPSPAWRIYLHMGAQFMSFRWDHLMNDSQYGFRPGRGTLDAWKVVLGKVIDEDNIYEYDLKGFFDSVNTDWVMRILERYLDVPEEVRNLIRHFSDAYVDVPAEEDRKLDESMQLDKKTRYFVSRHPFATNYIYQGESARAVEYLATGQVSGTAPDNYSDFTRWALGGFPQGFPISPILCNLALEPSLFILGNKFVQYADDGLFYGGEALKKLANKVQDFGHPDRQITPEGNIAENYNMLSAGVQFNHSKSGWVKRDGKWLKPLKFLGYVYNGGDDTMSSMTRNGKKLIYDKERMMAELNEREIGYNPAAMGGEANMGSGKETPNSFYHFCNSRYAGFVQSRLYNGSGNQQTLWGELTLKWVNSSFVDYLVTKGADMDNSNATSLCVRALLDIYKQVAQVAPQGKHVLKTSALEFLKGKEEEGDGDTSADHKPSSRVRLDRANFKARGRGLSLYAGSFADFQIFTEGLIASQMEKPTSDNGERFSREEQEMHYWKRYSTHKQAQVSAVLRTGERLIEEIREAILYNR